MFCEQRCCSSITTEVDVLIVGSGPAGLVLATQLSRFSTVSTLLIDARQGRLRVGQADGIQARSIEMFAAFGVADKVLGEAYWVNETVFWKPGADGIVRADRIRDVERGLSEFPHVILNQARIHDVWLDTMRRGARPLSPTYGRRLRSVHVDRDAEVKGEKYPVIAILDVLDSEGQSTATEKVNAQYVVGCDGAHSIVRRQLGLAMEGDSANAAWGVMDILCVTSFPDMRFKCVVHSADNGSMVIIPREGGYLVRLYIELDASRLPLASSGDRLVKDKVTADMIVEAAQHILAPYILDVKQVTWWSVYEIGQRLCKRFDDADISEICVPRIFIAGDACHTHSPKAGQGMNVGMQDGYNLGWKLGAVIKGEASPALLHTYNAERRPVAETLIAFDRELTGMLTGSHANGKVVDPAAFQAYFSRSARYTAGLGYEYSDGPVAARVASAEGQHLAGGFPVGERFHSVAVTRFWDAKPVQLGHAVAADGRWRVFVFNDRSSPDDPSSRVARLCNYLAAEDGLVYRYTRPDADLDSVIELLFVLQQRHADLQQVLQEKRGRLPELFSPSKGPLALHDQHKVFCDEEPYYHIWGANGSWESAYELRGVSRDSGAMVIVRPDGYIGAICGLDLSTNGKHDFLDRFFAGFMVPVAS
ncbi:hypothetical protein ANO11243_070250 [Dothideomycetidae sp. 11243]|nr:hypothetical protein ANO11243_070250 [fungal sp. No.11243]